MSQLLQHPDCFFNWQSHSWWHWYWHHHISYNQNFVNTYFHCFWSLVRFIWKSINLLSGFLINSLKVLYIIILYQNTVVNTTSVSTVSIPQMVTREIMQHHILNVSPIDFFYSVFTKFSINIIWFFKYNPGRH